MIFDRIAPRYDLANTVLSLGLHRRWKRAVVEAALARPGRLIPTREGPDESSILDGFVLDDLVLDAGTGTGDLAYLAAARGARVIGVDLSAVILAVAAAKSVQGRRAQEDAGGAQRIARRIALLQGDLSHLPLADGSVTSVMSAFVLRHLPDPERAFRELRRVLIPGGRLAVLEFAQPDRWIRPLYDAYSLRVIPALGGLLTGDRAAYEFLVRSIRSFPEPAHVATIVEAAGFQDVRRRPLTGGIAVLYTALNAGGL